MPKLHAEVKPVAHEAGIGAVAKLKAAFSFFPPLLVLSLIPLSHLCLGKTSLRAGEVWRALAPPLKGLIIPISRGGGDFPVDK